MYTKREQYFHSRYILITFCIFYFLHEFLLHLWSSLRLIYFTIKIAGFGLACNELVKKICSVFQQLFGLGEYNTPPG